jgi:DNA-binding NarL/FixJ family response regulator
LVSKYPSLHPLKPQKELPMSQITILIVDDNFVARRGLRSLFQKESDITVKGEASTGRAAIDWMVNNTADVVLMDVRMPDKDGIEATAEILKLRPGTKVLMLTVVEDQATLLRALLAGARGYLVYGRFNPEELIKAIHVAGTGGIIAIPPVAPALLANIQSHVAGANDFTEMESMEPLTAREKDILGLIALGRGNQEIAAALSIEEKTVKNHINNIYSKLQIKSRYEAISYMLHRTP